LLTLRTSGHEILESDDFVNQLEESKKVTEDINIKLTTSKHIEERIEENRKTFKPVAQHGARLYFAMQQLSQLDPMYHFSMKWFRDLFLTCFKTDEAESEQDEQSHLDDNDVDSSRIEKKVGRASVVGVGKPKDARPAKETKQMRVNQLKMMFREVLYKHVCMSLFEHHKLLFAFFMAIRVHESNPIEEQTFA